MEQAGVRRLLVVDDDGGVVGVVAAEDLLAAISQELAGLVQAMRKGIRREQGERKVISVGQAPRPIFPAFGTAMQ
jgi:CBS domain-containing protein